MTAAPGRGLQVERTTLAWRRTALSLVVSALFGARLLAPTLDGAAVAVAAAGLAAGSFLLLASRARGRRAARSLREHGDLTGGPGAAALVFVSATCVLAGAGALALVVVRTVS